MAKQKKYEDSHFEEYIDTQTIVDIDIEKRMKTLRHTYLFINFADNKNHVIYGIENTDDDLFYLTLG